MLVFTRKCEESVMVGGPRDFERVLKVTILEIKGGRVKLSVDVTDDALVDRWEVWQRVRSSDRPSNPTPRLPAHAARSNAVWCIAAQVS